MSRVAFISASEVMASFEGPLRLRALDRAPRSSMSSCSGAYIRAAKAHPRQKRVRACFSQFFPQPMCTSSQGTGIVLAGSPHCSGSS